MGSDEWTMDHRPWTMEERGPWTIPAREPSPEVLAAGDRTLANSSVGRNHKLCANAVVKLPERGIMICNYYRKLPERVRHFSLGSQ